MTNKPSLLREPLGTTTVDYAGTVSLDDLKRLTSEAYDAPQARNLAHLLAVVSGDVVKVTHVDEQGVVNRFVVSPKDRIADGRSRVGIVVAAQ
jgi:hypothetical protein